MAFERLPSTDQCSRQCHRKAHGVSTDTMTAQESAKVGDLCENRQIATRNECLSTRCENAFISRQGQTLCTAFELSSGRWLGKHCPPVKWKSAQAVEPKLSVATKRRVESFFLVLLNRYKSIRAPYAQQSIFQSDMLRQSCCKFPFVFVSRNLPDASCL